MPCFTDGGGRRGARADRDAAALGLDVRWVEPDEVDARNPALAPGRTLGASYAAGDGYIDPPTQRAGLHGGAVHRRRRGPRAHRVHRAAPRWRPGGRRTTTTAGDIATERVVLTGGPDARGRRRAGRRADPVGGVRHQVVVTEPHPDLAPDRLPMVFDVASGIYWRPEEGGVLWGMSNPDEPPGVAHRVRLGVLRDGCAHGWRRCCRSTAALGLRRAWAATIDYTPGPPADPRSACSRADGPVDGHGRGRGRWPRDDVGARGGSGGGRSRARRVDGRGRRDRARPRPVRCGRSQPARPGPDRAAVPAAGLTRKKPQPSYCEVAEMARHAADFPPFPPPRQELWGTVRRVGPRRGSRPRRLPTDRTRAGSRRAPAGIR